MARPVTRDCTLAEFLEVTAGYGDDETAHWYQVTAGCVDGVPQPGDTLRLTYGELRRGGRHAMNWCVVEDAIRHTGHDEPYRLVRLVHFPMGWSATATEGRR